MAQARLDEPVSERLAKAKPEGFKFCADTEDATEDVEMLDRHLKACTSASRS